MQAVWFTILTIYSRQVRPCLRVDRAFFVLRRKEECPVAKSIPTAVRRGAPRLQTGRNMNANIYDNDNKHKRNHGDKVFSMNDSKKNMNS